jgi:hypothetical protein
MSANPWEHDDDGSWLEPFDLTGPEVPEWEGIEAFLGPLYLLLKREAENEKIDNRPPLSRDHLQRSIYVFSEGWTDRLC